MAQSTQLQAVQNLVPAATAVVPAQSCCDCLTQRIQAIWDAFLALFSDFIFQCQVYIQGPGAPAPLPQEPQPRQPISTREEMEKQEIRKLFQEMVDFVKNDLGYIGEELSQMELIRTEWGLRYLGIHQVIREQRWLTRAANPAYTTEACNRTALMLKLGADYDGWRVIDNHFTPLHAAVFSGSFLAYKTLREEGAYPSIRYYAGSERSSYLDRTALQDTPIELAYNLLASQKSVPDYFDAFCATGFGVRAKNRLFPEILAKKDGIENRPFGTRDDVEKMIDYEVTRVADSVGASLGHLLPFGISKVIAGYYLSGDPIEDGFRAIERVKGLSLTGDVSEAQSLRAVPYGTIEERLTWIHQRLQTSNALFGTCTIVFPKEYRGNDTEFLLQLGADPNRRFYNAADAPTPLLTALVRLDFIAYRTLREWGADPNVTRQGKDCMEHARTFLIDAISKKSEKDELELNKIISYEEDLQTKPVTDVVQRITQVWQITPPLARLIAEYGKYYV